MSIIIKATFTKDSGDTPATGLTLADIDLYLTRQNKSTGATDIVWDGSQNPTAEVENVGAYTRIYTGEDLSTYDYHARATYIGGEVLDADTVTGGLSGDEDDIATAVWANATRTLTQSALAIAEAVSGSKITLLRGDKFEASLTGLGDISNRTRLYFTVKRDRGHADSLALIQIEEDDGLKYIDGEAAGAPGNGSITVDDENNGDLTIILAAVETAKLPILPAYYDVQMITATGVSTLTFNLAAITADVTRVTT